MIVLEQNQTKKQNFSHWVKRTLGWKEQQLQYLYKYTLNTKYAVIGKGLDIKKSLKDQNYFLLAQHLNTKVAKTIVNFSILNIPLILC